MDAASPPVHFVIIQKIITGHGVLFLLYYETWCLVIAGLTVETNPSDAMDRNKTQPSKVVRRSY